MLNRFKQFAGSALILQLMVILTLSVFSHASKMESLIQEAVYMFEMKGDVTEAIRILENVAAEGDQEDQESAYFYLGKIQELSGNNSSSNFYYKQSLSRTNETTKSYWLAERDAATSKQIESFLLTPINLRTRIKKFFGEGPTYCLFQDETVGRIDNGKIIPIPTTLPSASQILFITGKGIWYQSADGDSLHFQKFHASVPQVSYGIAKATDYLFLDNHAIIQTNTQLYIINKKGIVANIAEKYSNCTIEGFYKPTNDFILNCADNALHFVSSETGNENISIAQFDVIKQTIISRDLLFLVSNGNLYCYVPKKGNNPIWKTSINNVESMFSFERNLVVLEASGKVSLFDQLSGFTRASIRSDATKIYPLAKGTLGLFSEEGTITAVDTLLYPLWNFSFTTPIDAPPVHTEDGIFLYFGERKLYPIQPRYYGKKILRSEVFANKAIGLYERGMWDSLAPVLDTLFSLEPGNAEGWFLKALYLENKKSSNKEKQKAWSEAVRLSASNPRATNLILSQYGKSIGAKHINLLPISPKTRYPQLFGNKKDLFTIDPAADRLFCINTENGELKWSKKISHLENTPVIASDDRNLVVASGYTVNFFEFSKESVPTNIQLPGKAFEAKILDQATYITTWNGFILKAMKPDNKLAWSRKIYSTPFFAVKDHNYLYTCNLEGEFNALDDASGQIISGFSRRIQGPVSHMVTADSIMAIASSNNKLILFNPHQGEKQPVQILVEAPIVSLQSIRHNDESKLIIGLSDQTLMLYSKEGAPIWKYKGENSIFTTPFVKDGEIWIDQGNEIVSISLNDGKFIRKFNTPGGAGTPFVMNQTLFSASPKRILYGFSL